MGKLRRQELKGQVIWNQWQSSDLDPDNLTLKSMLLATILRCAASRDDKSWCKTLWSRARHRVDRTIIRFRGRKFNSSDHPQKREAPICGECSDLDLIPRLLMSLPLNFQGLLAEAFLIVGIPLEHASVGTHHLPSLHLPGCRGWDEKWRSGHQHRCTLPRPPVASGPAQAAVLELQSFLLTVIRTFQTQFLTWEKSQFAWLVSLIQFTWSYLVSAVCL